MKKFVVLMLVLAMATAANAVLNATLTGDDTEGAGAVTMNAYPEEGQPDLYYVITIQGTGTLTSALGADAPTDSVFVGTMADMGLAGTYGDGDIWGMTSYTSTYPTGVWIDASYTGAVAGDLLTLYETDGGTFTQLGQIEIIPEPATIALLCLGGLLIRKK